jgi:hypothetical protein
MPTSTRIDSSEEVIAFRKLRLVAVLIALALASLVTRAHWNYLRPRPFSASFRGEFRQRLNKYTCPSTKPLEPVGVTSPVTIVRSGLDENTPSIRKVVSELEVQFVVSGMRITIRARSLVYTTPSALGELCHAAHPGRSLGQFCLDHYIYRLWGFWLQSVTRSRSRPFVRTQLL